MSRAKVNKRLRPAFGKTAFNLQSLMSKGMSGAKVTKIPGPAFLEGSCQSTVPFVKMDE